MNNTISYRGSITRDGSIVGIKGRNFVSVSACEDSLCTLSKNGRISGFGFNATPKGVFVSISIGPEHSLALTRDGDVVEWDSRRSHIVCHSGNFVAIAAGGVIHLL